MTKHPLSPRLTRGRIAGLLAIAVVALGLGLIRSGRDGDVVRVPAGAHAGQLTLHPCQYDSEGGALAADCGTLVVPENRHDAGSRLIALPVKRIHARSADPGEPIFRLEGGPGQTNMDFPYASRYIGNHDLVLVGYRGVDGSSSLDCPEVDHARSTSGDLLGARSIGASARAFGDCADRLRAAGTDLGGYSLSERVDDLEAARRALRYDRVDLISESAGTRTAMVYAWRHPQSVHRSVMVGVNPPGRFLYEQSQTTAQLGRFSARSGSHDLAASMRRTAGDLPHRWGPLPIRRGNVMLGSFFGLTDASSAAGPIAAPLTLDSWKSAAKGDASGLWFESFASALLFPKVQNWGDSASFARADAAAAQRHFSTPATGDSPLGDAPNRFLWAGGRMLREWPANHDDDPYARIRTSRVETLLVSGSLDGATPLSGATRDLLQHLPNGHQVVLDGFGHTTDFWTEQTAAGSRLVNAYFDRGVVDDSRYTRQRIDFEPGFGQPAMAKTLVGMMALFALITVASLLWTSTRARTRRPFGAKASVAVRSALATVAGLGGWFLVALAAMVVLPDVPIDSELLAVLSIAVPAGLVVRWTAAAGARPTLAEGAVVLASALVGAWLGFHAAAAPLGLLTAIAGAVAAANLAVILQDTFSPLPPVPPGAERDSEREATFA